MAAFRPLSFLAAAFCLRTLFRQYRVDRMVAKMIFVKQGYALPPCESQKCTGEPHPHELSKPAMSFVGILLAILAAACVLAALPEKFASRASEKMIQAYLEAVAVLTLGGIVMTLCTDYEYSLENDWSNLNDCAVQAVLPGAVIIARRFHDSEGFKFVAYIAAIVAATRYSVVQARAMNLPLGKDVSNLLHAIELTTCPFFFVAALCLWMRFSQHPKSISSPLPPPRPPKPQNMLKSKQQ